MLQLFEPSTNRCLRKRAPKRATRLMSAFDPKRTSGEASNAVSGVVALAQQL